MHSPCENCPERKLMCHDKCENYMAWHDDLVAQKIALKGKFDALSYLCEQAAKRDAWLHSRHSKR